jgi:hypothetical protein
VVGLRREGKIRLSLELHPGRPPDLVLGADDIGGQYIPDFRSSKLVESRNHESRDNLSWLPAIQVKPTRSVRLVDNRGRKLWSAP